MYNRTVWRDHVTQYTDRFRETQNADGTVTHTPVEGEVLQQGTPQNEVNFNNIEEGVLAGHEIGCETALAVLHHEATLKGLVGVSGTVIVTNTQTYPFNNSGKTVALSPARNTAEYGVDVEVLEETGGQAGHVIVYDKLVNGFKIRFTGSASAVTVKYVVQGGIY